MPVITIDGGAATGKGTVRNLVGSFLGFHQLDSGVLYRAVAYECIRRNVIDKPEAWGDISSALDVKFEGEKVFLRGINMTSTIRAEDIGRAASIVSQNKKVREELMSFQLSMRKKPGLVADGRDQGFIFETPFRFFLTASAEEKAKRRRAQLLYQGIFSNYEDILKGIVERDKADAERKISPLQSHPEAVVIDTDKLNALEVADKITKIYIEHS